MRGRVSLAGKWQNFVSEPARSALAECLGCYACEQRWYRRKAVRLEQAEIEEVFLLGDAHCLIVLGVALQDGTRESYVMPLQFVAADVAAPEASLVAELEIQSALGPTRGALWEASSSRVFADTLLGLLRDGRVLPGESGALSGDLFLPASADAAPLTPRFLALEQSNSTILYGSSWLLKLLRKLSPGPNVELEVGRFLDQASPRPKVPRPVGRLQLSSRAQACTFAVVSEYVENRGSAWSVTLESLFTFFERVLAADVSLSAPSLPGASDAECKEQAPAALQELADPYFTWVRWLADRTAELHRALGRQTEDPGFGQEPLTPMQRRALYQNARHELARGFQELRERQRALPPDSAGLAERVLNAESALAAQLHGITQGDAIVTCIRCHGDYHLGQVLFCGDDFVVIDFEGEPGRPVSERRERQSPLRDVAGMLRSFAYAAETALRSERVPAQHRLRLAPWAEAFRAWVCVSFVQRYLAGIAGEAYCPASPTAARSLLEFYELEKALYEVNYELNNRPDWLPVPLSGLLRIGRI